MGARIFHLALSLRLKLIEFRFACGELLYALCS